MHSKAILIVLSIAAAMAAMATVAMVVTAGDPDNPPGPPETTTSYTLEDIYNRLNAGAVGTQSAFTEPSSGPPTGTMHTLNEIMAIAPQVDNMTGATPGNVLAGRTAWGLTGGGWGVMTGTMPDNGAVTIVPTTTNQTRIAEGYHNGNGYVVGDADLVAGNIKGGVGLFGVDGTLYAPVAKTGRTVTLLTGDDGDLQMGVAWPSPRFVDNGDGTVTDHLTGLIWLKDANCTYFFSGDTTGQNNRDWGFAVTAAYSLTVGYCGLTDGSSVGDWRLPNVRELQSLIDYEKYDPALPDGHPFTGVQSENYWSSTLAAQISLHGWYVYLLRGSVSHDPLIRTYYVWPVRGGQ
jgi:hypothetical protein